MTGGKEEKTGRTERVRRKCSRVVGKKMLARHTSLQQRETGKKKRFDVCVKFKKRNSSSERRQNERIKNGANAKLLNIFIDLPKTDNADLRTLNNDGNKSSRGEKTGKRRNCGKHVSRNRFEKLMGW